MATLLTRLALLGTLGLFGSGCTLHVVSGPVSQRRADHDYHYAMTPERARVLRPAPRPLAESERAKPRAEREQRVATREGRKKARRRAEPAKIPNEREARRAKDGSGTARGPAFRDRQRLSEGRQRARDNRRPDAKDRNEDDSRDVRYPYWASTKDERIDLEGTQVRRDRAADDRLSR